MQLIEKLRCGERIDEPIAVIAAHPDDETIGIGSRLRRISDLRLIHITDGAPRGPADAQRAGLADWRAYAQTREQELACALAVLGASGAARRAYGFPDQAAIFHVDEIAERLAHDLSSVAAVLSHPYEHGHPDHDSVALAVSIACRLREARGQMAPLRLEFASYHLAGAPVFGRFRPHSLHPETAIELTAPELAIKQAAVACFASQAQTLAPFPLSPERLRVAPDYDFTCAPGAALYERWGFEMTAGHWRTAAARVLRQYANGDACPGGFQARAP
jgi:LmbE family N-acetylglucosaminyl deacetylase